jgi:hypothetical protein
MQVKVKLNVMALRMHVTKSGFPFIGKNSKLWVQLSKPSMMKLLHHLSHNGPS